MVGRTGDASPVSPAVVTPLAPPMFGRATIRLGIGPHSSSTDWSHMHVPPPPRIRYCLPTVAMCSDVTTPRRC